MVLAAMFAAGCLAATAQEAISSDLLFEGQVLDYDYNTGHGLYIPEPISDGVGFYCRININPSELYFSNNEEVKIISAGIFDCCPIRPDNRSYKNLNGGLYSGEFEVKSHPQKMVYLCPAIGESNALEGEVTAIGMGAFAKCHGLTKVTIPNTVKTIRRGAFYDCTSLTDVVFADGCSNIVLLPYAFEGCTSLKKIDITCISRSVLTEGKSFLDCHNLQDVTLSSENQSVMSFYGRTTPSITRIRAVGNYPIIPDDYDPDENSTYYMDPFLPQEYANAVLEVPVCAKNNYLSVEPYNRFAHIQTYETDNGLPENAVDRQAILVNVNGRLISLINYDLTVGVYDFRGQQIAQLNSESPEFTLPSEGYYLLYNVETGSQKVEVRR